MVRNFNRFHFSDWIQIPYTVVCSPALGLIVLLLPSYPRLLCRSSPSWHADMLLFLEPTYPRAFAYSECLFSHFLVLPNTTFPEHLLKIMTSHTCTPSPSFWIISIPSSFHMWWMLLYIVCGIYFTPEGSHGFVQNSVCLNISPHWANSLLNELTKV